ncbi:MULTISPECIES: DUF2213 domain-containing protein [Enterococcus]|uniref:DUF2213 domain-containing protein n=1 Tax=Enterococcus TaxID=1350 RepID=UPI0001E1A2FC|nr:DUF2213 domain-containing protein [Enterococcus faecalis]EFM67213.1 hypothetical protein HMPREF9509_01759 [Enterococcus faecalis TX0411]EOL28526.1 hypothetical protein WO5_01506 [Enterococcus faecalis EnGen0354]MBD9861072.1 DUF2213 domain-containing protein [Enterococcus faecalis]MBD9894257.1 DUF2213 domain-containing protein [Enterococcus faecalis]MBW7652616.1 DUF2213 domain-containing protein [Enterococcus faecalis]
MVIRYDKAFIKDFKETDEGYLTITACPITRPGVFPYRRTDGGLSMEAKLPDELFSKTTVLSANAKPMTDDHPTEPVTAANYNKYSKGMTHNDAHVLDNKLLVSFTITDAETIKKINDGKRELSIGFQADVTKETGVYNGMQYDSVQRNMQINHIAIVDEGRAGHEVAIRGDSAAFMIDTKDKQTGGSNMPKLIIDSKEYEVDPVVKANYDAMQAKLDASEQRSSNVEKVEGERDALQSQVDNLTKELQTAKENSLTGDALDKRVQARVELVSAAKKFLGDSVDLVGKTDRQIKEAVITKTNSNFKGDGKSDDYINAYFDSMTAMATEKGFTASAVFNDAKDKDKEAAEEIEKQKNNRLNMNKKEDK